MQTDLRMLRWPALATGYWPGSWTDPGASEFLTDDCGSEGWRCLRSDSAYALVTEPPPDYCDLIGPPRQADAKGGSRWPVLVRHAAPRPGGGSQPWLFLLR
jgi:hypothetical protein